jgi:hypothetical protein
MGKIKPLFISVFVIVILVFLIGKIKVDKNQNVNGFLFEKYLHNPKRIVDHNPISEYNFPKYNLLIDSSDLNAIIKAYDFKTESIPWKSYKGKLIFKGDTFKVRICGHADSPTADKKGNNVSLRIKLKGGKKIHGVNKFSFILFSPIGNRAKVLQLFSESINLKMKPSNLVELSINNSTSTAIHFEPSTKKYCKKINVAYKKVGLFKSALQCFGKYSSIVSKKHQVDSTTIHPYFSRFFNGNGVVLNEEELQDFAKHFAVQLVLNLNGHGITPENFVAVISHETLNIEPLLTRSDIPTYCDTAFNTLSSYYQNQIGSFIKEHGEEVLFSSLMKQPKFIDLTKGYIKTIIRNKSSILQEFTDYNEIVEALFSGKFLDVNYNWRDNCVIDRRLFKPNIGLCMLNYNLNFWEAKLQDTDFWNVN